MGIRGGYWERRRLAEIIGGARSAPRSATSPAFATHCRRYFSFSSSSACTKWV